MTPLSRLQRQCVAAMRSGAVVFGEAQTYQRVSRELLLHLEPYQIQGAVLAARRKGWDVPAPGERWGR